MRTRRSHISGAAVKERLDTLEARGNAVIASGSVSLQGPEGPREGNYHWVFHFAGGRLVANAVTAEGEAQLFAWRGKLGGEMTRLSVARLSPVGDLHGWKPLMPVTQYWADKK